MYVLFLFKRLNGVMVQEMVKFEFNPIKANQETQWSNGTRDGKI